MARKTPDLIGLRDRVALVTGGTRGIGLALAERLAGVGARVVVTSRKVADCERVAKRLAKKYRTEAAGFACDVRDPKSVRELFASIRKWRHGPVAALVNNAGHPVEPRLWDTPLHRLTPEELVSGFQRVHDTDVRGSRFCTYYALPDMVKERDGRIVFVSSTPALVGYKGGPYTEAKAALLGLMRDVAREYGPKGIRANAVAFGNIHTSWVDQVSASERRVLEKEAPLRRFGEAKEAADAVLFLLGDQSSFVTGQTLVVDGGTVSR